MYFLQFNFFQLCPTGTLLGQIRVRFTGIVHYRLNLFEQNFGFKILIIFYRAVLSLVVSYAAYNHQQTTLRAWRDQANTMI